MYGKPGQSTTALNHLYLRYLEEIDEELAVLCWSCVAEAAAQVFQGAIHDCSLQLLRDCQGDFVLEEDLIL